MLQYQVLDEILLKYASDRNITRLIFRIIHHWSTPIDADLLVYWIINCCQLAGLIVGTAESSVKELEEKGIDTAKSIQELIHIGAIRSYTKDGAVYFISTRKFKG